MPIDASRCCRYYVHYNEKLEGPLTTTSETVLIEYLSNPFEAYPCTRSTMSQSTKPVKSKQAKVRPQAPKYRSPSVVVEFCSHEMVVSREWLRTTEYDVRLLHLNVSLLTNVQAEG